MRPVGPRRKFWVYSPNCSRFKGNLMVRLGAPLCLLTLLLRPGRSSEPDREAGAHPQQSNGAGSPKLRDTAHTRAPIHGHIWPPQRDRCRNVLPCSAALRWPFRKILAAAGGRFRKFLPTLRLTFSPQNRNWLRGYLLPGLHRHI